MNALTDTLASQLGLPVWVFVLVLIWTLTWKGFALWKSARKDHKIWFVILLVVQSLGLFEILYIFLFSKIELPETKAKKKKR